MPSSEISYDGIIGECKLIFSRITGSDEDFFDVDFEDEDDDYNNHQAPSTNSKTTSDSTTTNNIGSPDWTVCLMTKDIMNHSVLTKWNYNPIYIYKKLHYSSLKKIIFWLILFSLFVISQTFLTLSMFTSLLSLIRTLISCLFIWTYLFILFIINRLMSNMPTTCTIYTYI